MEKTFQEEEFAQDIKFTPPLYKQRYQFVKDLVEKYKPKKVADLGCADCRLLWMLKFCSCIEVLAGLDISASVMKENMFVFVLMYWCGGLTMSGGQVLTKSCSITPLLNCRGGRKYNESTHQLPSWAKQTRLAKDLDADVITCSFSRMKHILSPLPFDYLQPSERSLTVTLHHGSVAHKDPCMLGFDLVTCIELIEHLEELELKKFPEVVFGFMAPSIVVISTPNSEFNPLLPGVVLRRDPDHKFEWNQAQFQSWALEAAKCYDYSVEFTGVGHPPKGMENVGFCTQIGVFVRKYPQTGGSVQCEKPTETVYKTVFKAVYPSLKDEKYLQNAVISEVIFIAQNIKHHLMSKHEEYDDDPERKSEFQSSVDCLGKLVVDKTMEPLVNGNEVYIPLARIFSFPKVNQLCGTFEKLCKLIAGKVPLSSDGSAVVLNTEHENEED